jgi:hypothetical protein
MRHAARFGAVTLVAALTACGGGEPSGTVLELRRWAPSPYGPSPLARSRPIQALNAADLNRAEALLLRDGFVTGGVSRHGLATLPPFDEAAGHCPAPGPCRFWPKGSRERDQVMLDLGRPLPWLLLLPLDGRPAGVADVVDDGDGVTVVVLE